MSDCTAVCVDPDRIGALWLHVKPLIESAMRRTGISDFALVEQDVLAGLSLLWIAWDGSKIVAAVVTELSVIGGRKICTIVACGGANRQRWLHLISELEAYAKREGCAVLRMFGRRGWLRALPDYRQTAVIIEKEI